VPSLISRFAQNGDVQFDTTSTQIANQLKRVLAGWWHHRPDGDVYEPQIYTVWQDVEVLPILPTVHPIFVDTRVRQIDAFANLSVYQSEENQFTLSFHNCAYAFVDLTQSPYRVEVSILQQYADSMAFEDILFVTLAAPLRRLGIYFAHAFAAVPPESDTSVLLVGASHSGKTTTGLNLLLHRWRLLANDVVALQRDRCGVCAYPTPNLFTIRPKTFTLLPKLQKLLDATPEQSVSFTSHNLIHGRWGSLSKIGTILSPSIVSTPSTQIRSLPKAISISYLIEESLDAWDKTAVEAHTRFLTDLVSQAQTLSVMVGSDIAQIPHEITRALSASY